jgi:ankyrin repeat protein
MEGNFSTVESMIDRVDVNMPDMVEAKLFNGFAYPDQEITVRIGMTPLYYAVSRCMKHKPITEQYFESSGTEKDNYYKIAELLIEKGADVNYTTQEWFRGWSPIHWALEYMNMDMYNLLIANGANVQAKYYVNDDTLFGIQDIFFRYNECGDMHRFGSVDFFKDLAERSQPFIYS